MRALLSRFRKQPKADESPKMFPLYDVLGNETARAWKPDYLTIAYLTYAAPKGTA